MAVNGALAAPSAKRQRRLLADGSNVERRWLLWPPLAFFLLTVAGPVVALVHQALSGEDNAFAEALQSEVFVASVGRTLLLAVVVTAATVLVGTIYALAIAVGPVWVKALLMGGLLISLWTSVMVRTIGWMLLELPTGAIFWLLNKLQLRSSPIEIYQTTAAMYPAMIAVMLPFAVLPILAAVLAFDREQLRAATIFGAGPLLTLGAVVLPTIRQAMISGGVLVFVMSMGFYVTPMLLGGPGNMTVSGIINAQLNTANRADVGAAMSLLLVGGTVAIYLVADRLFKVSERWG
ncbi:ABC transporter permease subunit [Micromonospora zingiberis]|uniref:ABC transporter permease subunit n=1 Tax=Micromonospora zingiberis TaxID=2053011 RepID=A0A4V2LWN6_9ACTN|nr:ABC transporter permease subunit [Micromonospora zingiberis]TCB97245.1 ABC transporter permease subunit [Micromonospora zingiberis]